MDKYLVLYYQEIYVCGEYDRTELRFETFNDITDARSYADTIECCELTSLINICKVIDEYLK